MKNFIILLFIAICASISSQSHENPATFQAFLDLDKAKLPFLMQIVTSEKNKIESIKIVNGEEQISVKEIEQVGDSLRFKMPLFDNEFIGVFTGDEIIGNWYNFAKGKDYHLPLHATQIFSDDRDRSATSTNNIAGNWKVTFSKDTENEYPAVAEFRQEGNYLSGTFLTETGDYRYLSGSFKDNELELAAFDGSHAFLFTGIYENGMITGKFYSGNHWEENWEAEIDSEFGLRDADDLTYLNENDYKVYFSFPNADGNDVSLEDERFKNKVVIVQVLGSWCPNCMDESRLLKKLYDKYNVKGLEVVGLAFERPEEPEKIKVILDRYKTQLELEYPILWAGKASKKVASEALPMLSEIISFPTSIIINKQGYVSKIHTGFAGPATSEYENYVDELDEFLNSLLQE